MHFFPVYEEYDETEDDSDDDDDNEEDETEDDLVTLDVGNGNSNNHATSYDRNQQYAGQSQQKQRARNQYSNTRRKPEKSSSFWERSEYTNWQDYVLSMSLAVFESFAYGQLVVLGQDVL